jgi:hypothetical protein
MVDFDVSQHSAKVLGSALAFSERGKRVSTTGNSIKIHIDSVNRQFNGRLFSAENSIVSIETTKRHACIRVTT